MLVRRVRSMLFRMRHFILPGGALGRGIPNALSSSTKYLCQFRLLFSRDLQGILASMSRSVARAGVAGNLASNLRSHRQVQV